MGRGGGRHEWWLGLRMCYLKGQFTEDGTEKERLGRVEKNMIGRRDVDLFCKG